MSFKKPFKIEEIDLKKLRFTDVKSNSKKTIVYLKYDSGEQLNNLVFQTPSLRNINTAQFRNNNFEIDIPLVGKYNDKVEEFITFLNNLDDKIVEEASRNHKWFNNFTKNNKIKYQKTIRESSDSQYKNGMIKIKILKSNKFQTKIQNEEANIKIDDIEEDSWIKMILEVYAIWINENGFGLFIRPILVSLKKDELSTYNYELMDDSDEIDDIIHTVNNDNSIFIKAANLKKEFNNTTSILELPTQENDSNYFEELSASSSTIEEKNYNLSSTSTNN